jgi:hypothetical protein
LHRLFQEIKNKKPREFFRSIDNAGHGAGPSQAGAILALALLYVDTDECANKLLSVHATALVSG